MRPAHLNLAVLIVGALGLAAKPAHALLQSCNVAATALSFGVYDPTNITAKDVASEISLTCTVILLGLIVTWDIGISTGGSGSFNPRRMSAGAKTLNYNLYTDLGRTTIWGDGSPGTSRVSGGQLLLVGSSVQRFPVYGRIPALQDKAPDIYNDVVTVTVNY